MTRRLALATFLVSVGLLAPRTAGGFSYPGHRWAATDVPFFVNPVSRSLSESAVLTALQAAADHWTTQSGANIRYAYAGRTSGSSVLNNGLNEVFFRSDANGSLSGLTYYWYGSDGKLVDADTVFYEALYRLYPGSSGCAGAGGIYLEDLATHEFGHALGLGHSSDTTATMYPTMDAWCSQSWRTLAADDINGIRSAYPPVTSSVPAAPTGLLALAGTLPASQVRLSWVDASSSESGFVVQRSTNGSSFVQVAQVGSNVTTFTNTGLSAATKYWYRVYAINASGPSAYSNLATIATAPLTVATTPLAPSAPFSLTPEVWRGSTGVWYTSTSSSGFTSGVAVQLGAASAGDVPLAADFDGDGKLDPTTYRRSTGGWNVLASTTGFSSKVAFLWGASTDIPVVTDFDGDGKSDLAVFRPSNGAWYIRYSSSNYTTGLTVTFGTNGDVPVPGDYDGDKLADVAVWRPSNSRWYVRQSSNGVTSYVSWGTAGDVPVPGNYDGDGKTDVAIWRPSTGAWWIRNSSTGTVTSITWGSGALHDVPVRGDFDGDGKTDIAVWRPGNGGWYIRRSSNGSALSVIWGISSDTPISQ